MRNKIRKKLEAGKSSSKNGLHLLKEKYVDNSVIRALDNSDVLALLSPKKILKFKYDYSKAYEKKMKSLKQELDVGESAFVKMA